MTEEEYSKEFARLTKNYKKAKEKLRGGYDKQIGNLARTYAISNNPYNIGDIVEDRLGKLKIHQISYIYGGIDFPECIYRGVDLRADGKPKKKQTGRAVYQSNLIKK